MCRLNGDGRAECQGECQHTSCRACRAVAPDPCPRCDADDFRCLKSFGRCIKQALRRQERSCTDDTVSAFLWTTSARVNVVSHAVLLKSVSIDIDIEILLFTISIYRCGGERCLRHKHLQILYFPSRETNRAPLIVVSHALKASVEIIKR